MVNIWLSLFWTVLIGVVTYLADVVANMVVHECYFRSRVGDILDDTGKSDAGKRADLVILRAQVERQLRQTFFSGCDLVAVAIALDFACLGLWISNRIELPLLEVLDSDGIDRSVLLWLCGAQDYGTEITGWNLG